MHISKTNKIFDHKKRVKKGGSLQESNRGGSLSRIDRIIDVM